MPVCTKTCWSRPTIWFPQLLILSGWFSRAAGPPAQPSSSAFSSWTPQPRGPVDTAASAAVGMLPGEPLWSAEASSSSPSGWAPYWASRFDLLHQVGPVSSVTLVPHGLRLQQLRSGSRCDTVP